MSYYLGFAGKWYGKYPSRQAAAEDYARIQSALGLRPMAGGQALALVCTDRALALSPLRKILS